MTPQLRTALATALTFVALSVALVALPVPYVSWLPGGATDALGSAGGRPRVAVQGVPTYPTDGRLDFTYVSETSAGSHLSLFQALAAYWMPNADVLPRDAIYPPGQSAESVHSQETEQMETSQDDAVVAALRAAGQPVAEHPAVAEVRVGGPARGRLKPGDLVLAVDGTGVRTAADVHRVLVGRPAGTTARFSLLRDRVPVTVTVTSTATGADGRPGFGIGIGTGYSYRPRVSFTIDPDLGGPSAGLVFSLAVYDRLTPGALLAGRHVAGTGTITAAGTVGPIGGIQEKIAAASKQGATVFLVPAANCVDLPGVRTSASLVRVSTLADAVDALRTLETPGGANQVPRC